MAPGPTSGDSNVKSKKIKVLSLLTAIGLLAAAAGTVAADEALSPLIFSSASATFSHNGLNVFYRCDTFGIPDRTRSSNNNIRSGHSFNASVECWAGFFRHSGFVSANILNSVTSSACTAGQGGAAAGRTTIHH
jgi:hypothetical protein